MLPIVSQPFRAEPTGEDPRPARDPRRGLAQQMMVVSENQRTSTFWLHQNDLSIEGLLYWLEQWRLPFEPKTIERLRGGSIRMWIQGPHKHRRAAESTVCVLCASISLLVTVECARLFDVSATAAIRPDVQAPMKDTEEGWLNTFGGPESALGQAFLKGLKEYDSQLSARKIPVSFPAYLGGSTTRKCCSAEAGSPREAGVPSLSDGHRPIVAFRSLLGNAEETRWLREHFQSTMLLEHRILLDCGPDQPQPIARGQLLPVNVVPSSNNQLRAMVVCLHAAPDGTTSLSVVDSDGQRSYPYDGAAPPCIRVLEALLQHVQHAVILLVVCSGWMRYRDELAQLSRRNQLIFILTGQMSVYHLDASDPVLSAQFRLASVLMSRLAPTAAGCKKNSKQACAITASAMRDRVLEAARCIHRSTADTTLAEMLDQDGTYTPLAASPQLLAAPSIAPSVTSSKSEMVLDVAHDASPSSLPLTATASSSPQVGLLPPANVRSGVMRLDYSIPEPCEDDKRNTASVYCTYMKRRRFVNQKRQQIQVRPHTAASGCMLVAFSQ